MIGIRSTRYMPDSSDVTWRGIRSRMTLLKKGISAGLSWCCIEAFETNVTHTHKKTLQVADVSQSPCPGAFRIASIPLRG